MLKFVHCCDYCGSPLPTETVVTPFGVVESVKTFKAKEWDVSSVWPDLCEMCALKIDLQVKDLKLQYLANVK